MSKKEILNSLGIKQATENMAEKIAKDATEQENTILVGVLTMGAELSKRLKKILKARYGIDIETATLDTRPYRDDLKGVVHKDKSKLPENIEGSHVIIVDDVISTGRTVRAAMDAIMRRGRPRKISTAALVDIGHRELPIRADYTGIQIHTSKREEIKVVLSKTKKDCAYISLRK
jgi:pyrimidine operon attenuation protein / uracil phosphoribosyltransferase